MNKKCLVKFQKEWKSFRLKKRRFKIGLKSAFFQSGQNMVFVKKLNLFPFIVLMQNESIKRVLKSCKTKKP